MGHSAGKKIIKKLAKRIDGTSCRAPSNKQFFELLSELYTEEEAIIAVNMPYSLTNIDHINKTTGIEKKTLIKKLKKMSNKGLVMDLWFNDEFQYMVSPMIVGLYEFCQMKAGKHHDIKKLAKLFNNYLHEDGIFYSANYQGKVANRRTLPHEGSLGDHIEILDYERASYLIKKANKYALATCSCRHEKYHLDDKHCNTPLESCLSFGFSADYLIRNGFGKEITEKEALKKLEYSEKFGLVITADNIKQEIASICQCCGCCCSALAGISKFGYPDSVVSSGFMSEINNDLCNGCGKCAKICPVNAIALIDNKHVANKKTAKLDTSICLGCGICIGVCKSKSLKLNRHEKRIILPESTFEKIILQSLERGTLQNQIFDDPNRLTHKFMRGFIGGFLNLNPVKKTLMSDTFRSSFLNTIGNGVKRKGKSWLLDI
ncbi:MAG: 4Fe-4S dicluster domain-containing protein [Desulfobacterales bacterium]|nr:4Fe-4S dicluster domain-containing protein [Desulfobacterales bacterium]MCP4161591.1 4Fe-4S dicluster domain-containing protein [Deltaproteobacteria bacterium]